jgi:integrase
LTVRDLPTVSRLAQLPVDKAEELYPRKWNHQRIDVPEIEDQNAPAFTGDQLTKIVAKAKGQEQPLYALLGGSGIRIGELLALNADNLKGNVLHIRENLWNKKLDSPKTKNGVREVDLHPVLADMLRAHLAGRTEGFMFMSKAGGPLHQSNLLLGSLHKILKQLGMEKAGLHGFRRFRNTFLRQSGVPDGLIQFWMGHAPESMADVYDKCRADREFRSAAASNVGLGFDLPGHQSSCPCDQIENLPVSTK